MLDFLISTPPGWRAHRLSGRRGDEWSVSVSGNWRITFVESDGFIDNLNLEDYH
jgi:proteic killer suppression protein